MSFQISYRRLAAVNVFHSFYLDKEGSPFYALNATDQQSRLADLLANNRYPLSDEIEIVPTPLTEKTMRNQKIVFRQTSMGVVLGVSSGYDENGNLVPTIPISGDLRLQFYIRLLHPPVLMRSNIRLNPAMPARFYFTNDPITGNKTFPSLSAPLQPAVEGVVYEMGETAIVNNNPARAQKRTNTLANSWSTISNESCINENDRMLLPRKFPFTFDTSGITQATFTLLQGNVAVMQLPFTSTLPLQTVHLDFQQVPVGYYTLHVNGNNSFERTYQVYINPLVYEPNSWGVIDLVMHAGDANFDLVDADDQFVQPQGPTFELRFDNRDTYWKYYLQNSAPIQVDANWDEVLPVPAGMKRVFISKQPYPLMQAYQKVQYTSIPLPNPSGENLGKQGDLICSEILLPKLTI
ncbi:hypothetical protein LX64_01631 [Chitinophaga skermanii]|uniref:Uncharacterized protein n=1 Tax=Chitinophaga skermanii TaxID=331697 RepID=A0A327QS85_9BACT|nr:hypothetical protein [Chitinophaga skermanii]RAJ06504.1 hypothetical protein LX64_01631 [Chitinophaga skermanii]